MALNTPNKAFASPPKAKSEQCQSAETQGCSICQSWSQTCEVTVIVSALEVSPDANAEFPSSYNRVEHNFMEDYNLHTVLNYLAL